MHVEGKLTNETFPAEPEKATLEGKNKFVGFWLFLGGETVLFASLFGTYLALKKFDKRRSFFARNVSNATCVYYDNASINK